MRSDQAAWGYLSDQILENSMNGDHITCQQHVPLLTVLIGKKAILLSYLNLAHTELAHATQEL